MNDAKSNIMCIPSVQYPPAGHNDPVAPSVGAEVEAPLKHRYPGSQGPRGCSSPGASQ